MLNSIHSQIENEVVVQEYRLFNTPSTVDELHKQINNLNGSERIIALQFVAMTTNLIAKAHEEKRLSFYPT